MKQIKLFIRSLYVISLIAIGFAVTSCTNELWGGDDDVQVFKMKLNIGMQQFDGIGSRAASSFPDGASLLMRFDSEAYGTAVYDKTADNWNVSLKGSLKNTSSGSCDLYYSPNRKPSSTYTLSLDHSTPLYSAKGVYSYSESGPVITATLKPAVPRVCFKGTSGKKISLSGLSYYKSVDASKSDALSIGSSDISLTVNGSSTDYIYGFFAGSNRDLTLTVDGVSYTRTIESSMFANGQSGYIDIPTASNLGKWKEAIIQSITLNKSRVEMGVGETFQLSATISPSTAANKTLKWTSSSNCVTVSSTGLLTAKSKGQAKITATTTDGRGVEASCDVTVTTKENSYEYEDLGLSVKWATMNVGAKSPEEFGWYFAWGETRKKTEFTWANYSFWRSGTTWVDLKFWKYIEDEDVNMDKNVLDLEDDAAYQNWGGKWRMPTDAEFDELRRECFWTWTSINGVKGVRITSKKNGNSIFLPMAGSYSEGKEKRNFVCDYWCSTIQLATYGDCVSVIEDDDDVFISCEKRFCGLPVRAVFK